MTSRQPLANCLQAARTRCQIQLGGCFAKVKRAPGKNERSLRTIAPFFCPAGALARKADVYGQKFEPVFHAPEVPRMWTRLSERGRTRVRFRFWAARGGLRLRCDPLRFDASRDRVAPALDLALPR